MKEPKQVKVRMKPADTGYEYIPPLQSEAGQPTEQEVEQVEEESQDETSKEGFMSALPPSVQAYVEKKTNRVQKASQEFFQAMSEFQQPVQDSISQAGSQPAQNGSESGGEGDGEPDTPKECTAQERAFLDTFRQIQEAGRLLGMARTSSPDSTSQVLNMRMFPVPNKVEKSDELFAQELDQNREVYGIFAGIRHQLVVVTRNLLLEYDKDEERKKQEELRASLAHDILRQENQDETSF